jgi:hypothetical protein
VPTETGYFFMSKCIKHMGMEGKCKDGRNRSMHAVKKENCRGEMNYLAVNGKVSLQGG